MADTTGIRIVVDTATPAVRRLAHLVGSLRTPLTEIGRNLVASSRRRFQRSEGPTELLGVPHAWAPLQPETIERRRGGGSGVKPLINTADLLKSVQARVTGIKDTELHVGTNHELAPGVTAAIHQLGGLPAMAPGPAAIPARPFLGIDRDDGEMIERVVTEYLHWQGGL